MVKNMVIALLAAGFLTRWPWCAGYEVGYFAFIAFIVFVLCLWVDELEDRRQEKLRREARLNKKIREAMEDAEKTLR